MELQVHGHCTPRFEALQQAFLDNFRQQDEIGASVALFMDGELAVNLWAGDANPKDSLPWQENTLVNVFSTTKGVTAIGIHHLVDQGELDLDKPVAHYWPEFRQNGKGDIPVRWLLNHKAGLSGIRQLLPNEALYDWAFMCEALAREEPWWHPGKQHGYHAVTFGWLTGEIIRRITGEMPGDWLRQALFEPLELDFHIGLPDEEHARVARLKNAAPDPNNHEAVSFMQKIMSDPTGITARAFANPMNLATDSNKPEWRRAQLPAANGHGTAASLARLYGILASGGQQENLQVLKPETIHRLVTPQSSGTDLVLGIETRFSDGFMLPQDRPGARIGYHDRCFGHPGAGGSVAFADLENGFGFAYVMNRMGPGILLDPRAESLIAALYEAL